MSSSFSDRLEEIDEEQCTSEEEEYITEDASSVSSSPSIPDENINFDLVYALHTFVATVEGQASVVKGDSLVLMEDTNIYWWLVEVLNTREVGYIPAENIETPYERLARLNKHRNVEITFPSINDPIPLSMHPLTDTRRVTIVDESSVFHYEVESDEEDELEVYEEEEQEEPEEEWNEPQYSEMNLDPIEPLDVEKIEILDENLQEIRVFAGNIGQDNLFHAFSISHQTTADELVSLAVYKFGVQEEHGHSTTIEYYVAVQGLDGDEYVLSAQDKPLSIFKTLTDSLTTPMPSLSNYRRISQQSISSIQSSGKRPRSSSFSNYEQTNHNEDSVIRLYLHRRIKRAHENLVYIKVSLYPEGRKQKKPNEMDRMDKVIAVNQESLMGQVIQLALEKFHVPHSEENVSKKYKLSVKGHHNKEITLDPNEIMFNVLEKLSSNTITSELLFILRKSGKRKIHFQPDRRPSILDILMDSTPKGEKARSDERSINTLHSSSSLFHFTRRSSAPCTESLMEPVQMARSNSITPVMEKRKESLKQQLKRLVGWGSNTTSPATTRKHSLASPIESLPKSRQGSQDQNASRFEVVSHVSLPLSEEQRNESCSDQDNKDEQGVQEIKEEVETNEEQSKEVDQEVEQDEQQVQPEEKQEVQETTEETTEEIEEEIVQDTKEEKPLEIQAEYTMWVNNQPNEDEIHLVSSMSTSKVSLVSEVSSIQPIHTYPNTFIKEPHHGLDDLYLLVAHGVDFLKTKEDTKWEEEGGYEFHPWNRPQSSFAVRPKDKKVKQAQKPISPPLTPLAQPVQQQSDEQQKELAMSMAKRILSGKVETTPPTETNNTPSTNTSNNQNKLESLNDDDELQRIVAAHIVF